MNVDPTSSRLAAEGVAYAPQIAAAAQRHGLDPTLLAAVAAQETGGPGSNAGHNVVGDGGHGHGVFQIDDRWHDFARTAAAMDPERNADYAAGMLSGLLSRYGGDVRAALSAYNSGSPTATGTETAWPDGRRLGYADSVLAHYALLGGGTPSGAAAPPPGDGPGPAAASADGRSGELAQLLSALLASLGALESPMLQPSPAPPAPQPYQAQTIDYGSLLDGDN